MPDYLIKVRPEGQGPEPVIRVRRLLKLALRVCRLRCIRIEEVAAGPKDAKTAAPKQSV